MKTIEERAKAFCEKNICVDCGDRNNCDRKCLGTCIPTYDALEWLIQFGKSEHTELTRWHDPKEEMPDNNHCVLIKISDGQQERIYIGSREGDVWIADGGNSFHADPASSIGFDGVIIGWREIHE